MTAPVTEPGRTGPVIVDTVVTGEWIITLNADREIYRDGAIAVTGGVITEVGKRAAILAKYRPATLIDEPDSIVIPGMVNGHRHLLCCAKGAMPEGGQTLSALRQFIYPSFAALTEDDMHAYARHAAAEMIRFGTTLFEEPGCNHLEAVLEALAASGIRARTGPWTWDQAGPAGADGLPDWLRMDADAALDRLAEGVQTVRKFNHPRILDAVTIEGVGTCSDALNRGAADLAREYDSLFVLHKSTSEAEVELELKVFGERPVAPQPGGQHRLRLDRPLGRHGAHRRRGRPPAQAAHLARRSRAPQRGRGDQPPRPRRDRDRPATPLAHRLTHDQPRGSGRTPVSPGTGDHASMRAVKLLGYVPLAARIWPGQFRDARAVQLMNRSMALLAAHREGEALAVAEQGIAIHRSLAAARPRKPAPGLAAALNNLSYPLRAVGRRGEALIAAGEAVRMYRGLAAANPRKYRYRLANSLGTQAELLAQAREPSRALTATGEAARIYQDIRPANRDAAQASEVLFLHGQLLGEESRHREAARSLARAWHLAGPQAGQEPGFDRAVLTAAYQADPAGFLAAWRAETGASPPPWLTADNNG